MPSDPKEQAFPGLGSKGWHVHGGGARTELIAWSWFRRGRRVGGLAAAGRDWQPCLALVPSVSSAGLAGGAGCLIGSDGC